MLFVCTHYDLSQLPLMQGMEASILEQLGWSPMPYPTLCGLLFSTGLLQGLPDRCLSVLQDIILASYGFVCTSGSGGALGAALQGEGSSGAAGETVFATLYQVSGGGER